MILATSDGDDGNCFIETSNLDGETNLKIRKASELTQTFGDDTEKLGAVPSAIYSVLR